MVVFLSKMLIFLCLIFSVFISSQAHDCPDLTLPTDVPIDDLKVNILKSLWFRPLPGWSKNALKLRSLTLPLIGKADFWEKTFSETFTIWVTLFQNRLKAKNLNACDIGQYLDGIAQCRKEHDNTGLINSSLEDLYYYASNYFYDDGLLETGCGRLRLQVPSWKCVGNGFNYDIDTIWSTVSISQEIINQVKILYKSKNLADKFLAALASFAVTPDSSLTSKLNQYEFYELLDIYNAAIQPQECCEIIESRLSFLSNQYLDGILERLERSWDEYKKPDACFETSP